MKLPAEVTGVLGILEVPPRLRVHLELVHEVAVQLISSLREQWPDLAVDGELVCFGAATHDLGKCRFPDELSGPGHQHEEAGYQLLLSLGVAPERARFARTHGAWAGLALEDLLVAMADKVWRGRRDEALEGEVVERIASALSRPGWEIFASLDDILCEVSASAPGRLEASR